MTRREKQQRKARRRETARAFRYALRIEKMKIKIRRAFVIYESMPDPFACLDIYTPRLAKPSPRW